MQVPPFAWRTDVMLIPISCLSIPSSQCSRAVEILIVRVGRPFTTVIEARDSRSSVRWTTIWRWESSGSKELSSRSCSCFFPLALPALRFSLVPCPSQLFLATNNHLWETLLTPLSHLSSSPGLMTKPQTLVGLSMRVQTDRYETAKFNTVTLTRLGGRAIKCRVK